MHRPRLIPRRAGAIARRGVVVAPALVLALVMTGCSDAGSGSVVGRAPAASVGDAEITLDQVTALVDAQTSWARVAAKTQGTSAEELADTLSFYEGEGAGTYATTGTASALTTLIQLEVYKAAVATNGGEITDEALATARKELIESVTGTGVKESDIPEVLVEIDIQLTVLEAELAKVAVVDDAALRAAYEDQVDNYTQLCTRVIVNSDPQAVTDALDRVVAGEDFGEVSAEVTDLASLAEASGDFGCQATADLAGTFGDVIVGAKAGDTIGPIEVTASTGEATWAAVQVDQVNVPTFEDIAEQLRPTLSEQAVTDALADARASLEVTVDPRHGTWDPATFSVVPPKVPGTTTTTATAGP